MLTLLFAAQGVVYQHIVPRHMTINALYLLLRNFKNPEETREQEEAWSEKNLPFTPQLWAIHCFHCQRIFGKGKIEVLTHPAYNTNLVPCDFWGFGALKWELRKRYFELDVKLVTAVNCFFQNLPPEEFHKMMTEKWKERMLGMYCEWWRLLQKRYCGSWWWQWQWINIFFYL